MYMYIKQDSCFTTSSVNAINLFILSINVKHMGVTHDVVV